MSALCCLHITTTPDYKQQPFGKEGRKEDPHIGLERTVQEGISPLPTKKEREGLFIETK